MRLILEALRYVCPVPVWLLLILGIASEYCAANWHPRDLLSWKSMFVARSRAFSEGHIREHKVLSPRWYVVFVRLLAELLGGHVGLDWWWLKLILILGGKSSSQRPESGCSSLGELYAVFCLQGPRKWRHNGRDGGSNHQPIIYPTVYSGADQRKHQSSASPAFVQGIHRCARRIRRTMASDTGNVSNWWRHHG